MQREVRDESLRAERQANRFAVTAQLEAIDEIESDVAHGAAASDDGLVRQAALARLS